MATAEVLTVNDAVDFPVGTVIEAGVVADFVLDDSFTTRPPVGAFPVSVSEPVDAVPPPTVDGLTLNEARVTGMMVRVAVSSAVPSVALIVAKV